ncbi:hypothetical protein CPB83DRAFT_470577 [Crepidotus variabilis]|uniref:Uncharacterized protein n=1 Tax=Crepidotus variabilis TaxID=179855 RepID=A0A9P6EP38_9AGAR|nr:hypothetical protein CPB83DRAFT_470577 [Crepidotus variabilis]
MNAVHKAIEAFTKLSKSKIRGSDASIQKLSSVVAFLGTSTLSTSESAQLSDILRIQLQPLYRLDVSATLAFCAAVLKVIHEEKVLPILKGKNKSLTRPWEAIEVALLSGMLDFLDIADDAPRKPFADAINPIICASFFQNDSLQIALLDPNLLTTAYLFLTEMLEACKKDADSLRELIKSRRLGQTIIEIKDFLALEAVLNVLGKLISTAYRKTKQHMVYLTEVFDPSVFKCGPQILRLFDVVNEDWNLVTMDIMRVLAAFDKSFPQLFNISSFTVESIPLSIDNPFIIDKIGFTGNLDQEDEDGTLRSETLQIPYSCVREAISVVALTDTLIAVDVKVSRPPVVGRVAMALPAKESYKVHFKLKKKQEAVFRAAIAHRKLPFIYPAVTSKLSQAPSELLEGIKSNEEPMSWKSKANVLSQMASPPQSGNPGDGEEGNDHSFAAPESDNTPQMVFVPRDRTLSTTKVDDKNLQLGDKSKKPKQVKTVQLDQSPAKPVTREQRPRQPNTWISSASETDNGSEYQPTQALPAKEEVVQDTKTTTKTTYRGRGSDYRQNANSMKTKAADEAATKPTKRALEDVNIEKNDRQTAKRRRLTESQSPIQNPTLAKGRRSSMSKTLIFDDFDDLPKATKVPQKPRARAMKGKNGKSAAPVKSTPPKKVQKQVEDPSAPITMEPHESTPEIVKRRSLRNSIAKTTKIAEKSVAKKFNKAPWEESDFIKLKEESSDRVLSEELDPHPVTSTDNEVSITVVIDEALAFGDKYVDSMEPTKAPMSSAASSPHAMRVKKEVITIDLTNSPPFPVKKSLLKPEKAFKPLHNIPAYSLVTPPAVFNDEPSAKSSSVNPKASRMKSPIRQQPNLSRSNDAVSNQSHRKSVPATLEPESPITRDDFIAVEKPSATKPIPRNQGQQYNSKTKIAERRPERLPSPPRPPTKVFLPRVSDDEGSHQTTERAASPNNRKHKNEKISPLHSKSTPQSREAYEFRNNLAPDYGRSLANGRGSRYEACSGLNRGRTGRRQFDNYVQEDPMDRIAAILEEITDVIIHRTETKFTSIPKELRISEAQARQQFVNGMREVNNKLVRHYNVMFDLDAEYNKISEDILKGLRSGAKASAEMSLACKRVIQDFNRNSVCKKFGATLAPDRPTMAILADPSIGFPML